MDLTLPLFFKHIHASLKGLFIHLQFSSCFMSMDIETNHNCLILNTLCPTYFMNKKRFKNMSCKTLSFVTDSIDSWIKSHPS